MGGNIPVLQTERLILREFARDDLEDFFKIFRDEEANTFFPGSRSKRWRRRTLFSLSGTKALSAATVTPSAGKRTAAPSAMST